MTTFYIASSSHVSHRAIVQSMANKLFTEFGWRWHNGYDWTEGFKEEVAYPKGELLKRAIADRDGAKDADVFIFYEGTIQSLGANREYGVRWGSGKTIHRISPAPEHLFDMTNTVISYPDLDTFIKELS